MRNPLPTDDRPNVNVADDVSDDSDRAGTANDVWTADDHRAAARRHHYLAHRGPLNRAAIHNYAANFHLGAADYLVSLSSATADVSAGAAEDLSPRRTGAGDADVHGVEG